MAPLTAHGSTTGASTSVATDRNAKGDQGLSLIEILVTLSLMGMTVVAVLSGLQATIRASVIDRDHATAFAWMQTASDEIHRATRTPCTAGTAESDYDAIAQAVPPPPVWASLSPTIEVISVEYLGKTNVDDDFEWSSAFCFEGGLYVDSPLYTQRVTLRVTTHDGKTVRTLQMVKSE